MDSGNPQGSVLSSSIQHASPERCVRLAHNPSVHVYYALKNKIEQSSRAWVCRFVELGGLDSFLQALVQLGGSGFTSFSDAVLQLDCISCVRALLNFSPGMNFMASSEDSISLLVQALETPNTLPKKHMFEVLTAVCVFSKRGHHLLDTALEEFRKQTCRLHRHSVILEELKLADTATYRTSLMALVNAILSGIDDTQLRLRTRQQLEGMELLDLLQYIRRDEKDTDLAIQMELFMSAKHQDEAIQRNNQGIDVTDATQLFNSLHTRVFGSPHMTDLLHVLQDLHLLHRQSADRSLLWKTLSQTTHHIAGLRPGGETSIFLDNLQNLTKPPKCNEPVRDTHVQESNLDNRGDATRTNMDKPVRTNPAESLRRYNSDIRQPLVVGLSHLPPTPPEGGVGSRRDSGISVWSAGSPYDNTSSLHRNGSGRGSQQMQKSRLPSVDEHSSLNVVRPNNPVKPVRWVKIPAVQANKPMSLWRQIRESSTKQISLDYVELEKEFHDECGKDLKNADDEVQLLTSEQSLNLSLLLARLEASPEELATCIHEANLADLSLPALRLLTKAMPCKEEMLQLCGYSGERYDVAPPEQFLLNLADHPDYQVLLDALLFKAEYTTNFTKLKTAFQAYITACRDVLHHPGLRDFVRVMIDAGNFMNANNHIGRAAGVRLSSWQQMVQVRGRSAHTNVLEAVVRQIVKEDEEVMMFTLDFVTLEQAAGHSLEELKSEVTSINNRLKTLLQQLATASSSSRRLFSDFIEDVKENLEELQEFISRLRALSQQVAVYLTENPANFDLQAHLKQLHEFFTLIKASRQDCILGRQQKRLADTRKKELDSHVHETKAAEIFTMKACMSSSFMNPSNSHEQVLNHILNDVHRGQIAFCTDDAADTTLVTPENEDNPFILSHIPLITSSPMVNTADLESFALHDIAMSSAKKTYVDRVETILEKRYHRQNQADSASMVRPDSKATPKSLHLTQKRVRPTLVIENPHCRAENPPSPQVRAPLANMEITTNDTLPLKITVYPRLECTPVSKAAPWVARHRRSNSDIDQSVRVEDKWKRYERQTGVLLQRQKEAGPEGKESASDSDRMVTAMGLERGGHLLGSQDLVNLEEEEIQKDQYVVPSGERKKKRNSLGLLKRFSRMVLGPRNSLDDDNRQPSTKPADKTSKKKKKGGDDRKRKSKSRVPIEDKENAVWVLQ